ncbi:type II toxin-antitoxin system RelE/ParE family toxin [Franconibacter helveticus]|uniref:type II toxin-antitoxin system RelE/ParE family toxin n=1 Tax=Franconibacter helveticus TaxID=357240 RepID=UPI000497E1A8|nr:type II toxin-antitoxin system RelE/ParE family toxin [Franconibacter helveticus]
MEYLEFIETAAFTRTRKNLMAEDELREFQAWLLENHELGDTVAGTGGCKKVRWNRPGSGKSGGLRIIYYVRAASGRIYLIVMYPKNTQENLTNQQKAQIKSALQQMN